MTQKDVIAMTKEREEQAALLHSRISSAGSNKCDDTDVFSVVCCQFVSQAEEKNMSLNCPWRVTASNTNRFMLYDIMTGDRIY